MKKVCGILLCLLAVAGAMAEGGMDEDAIAKSTIAAGENTQDAMAFLGKISAWETSRSPRLTEEDVLELFAQVARAPAVSVMKSSYSWFCVYDISDVQILNPITMQKGSGYKALEFPYADERCLAFVKKPDFLRRIDAMLKTGNIDLIDKFDMCFSAAEIADVLWTNGGLYKVRWVE